MNLEIRILDPNDTQVREAYCRIRDESLAAIMGVSRCYYDDPHGCIIVALCEGRLLGGIRLDHGLMGRSSIPMECLGYDLSSYLPSATGQHICQLTGLGLLVDLPNKINIAAQLIDFATRLAVSEGSTLMLVHASLINSRLYKRVFYKMGLHLEIMRDLELPILPVFSKCQLVLSSMSLIPLLAETLDNSPAFNQQLAYSA